MLVAYIFCSGLSDFEPYFWYWHVLLESASIGKIFDSQVFQMSMDTFRSASWITWPDTEIASVHKIAAGRQPKAQARGQIQ